ncbi:MAG: TolB-like 6-bladed beta-propeller domain-containing protein [Muribaculaceae bacterium]|nr:TolB-like 6-bladed beta-propeller domain-containing protein [Muribaculaceae bacterium]
MKKFTDLTSLLPILFLFLFISCNDRNNKAVEFNNKILSNINTEEIDAKVIETGYIFGNPTQIIMANDTLLMLFDKSLNGKLFHLISTNGYYIGSFGEIGQGPNEFLSPHNIGSDLSGKICIYDFMKAKSMECEASDFPEIFNSAKWNDYAGIIPEGAYRFSAVYPLGNDRFIGVGLNNKCRLMLINNQDSVYNYTSYPIQTEDEEANWSLWNNCASNAVSPDGKHFVVATSIGMAFEVFDIENDHIKSKTVVGVYEPKYDIANGAIPKCAYSTEECFIGFKDICALNDSFCGIVVGSAPGYNDNNIIYIFDYDGNLHRKLETPYRIKCLTSDGKSIFAIGYTDGDEEDCKLLKLAL